jgi:hypothetical protein
VRRLVRTARAAYGIALIVVPAKVLRAYGGDPADRAATTAARVLGGRHLAQAALTGNDPGPIRKYGGALVDALHAASMFALARADAPRRRPALIDGSIAAAFCLAGIAAGDA